MFYRLLKPDWGKKELRQKDGTTVPNPDFVREIEGPDTLGDQQFTDEELAAYNEQGYNVYWFINHPSSRPLNKFLNGRDIDVFNAVFVDMDLKDGVYATKEAFFDALAAFPAPPSLVVDSGNGVHAYWWIDNLNRESYVYAQFALIQHFKTDQSIWTPLQLMRAPGYFNTKDPNNFKPAQPVDSLSSGQHYSIEAILEHLPEVTEDHAKKMIRHLDKLDGRNSEDLDAEIVVDELPAKFVNDMKKDRILRELFESPVEACGDRSSADMKVANILFSKDYDRKEALQVLMNTKKARSRSDRLQYAHMTVDKVYSDRPQFVVKNAFERQQEPQSVKNLGRSVNGPKYWDNLHYPWRTKQVLGLIGGSGIGKTTCTLQAIKSSFENTPESDDIAVMFSLEMTEGEIYDSWNLLTGGNPEMAKRLYVVANEDDEGNSRNIGLQEIYWYCRDIEKRTGKKIVIVGIDHVDAMSRHVDLKKEPNFKAGSKDNEGFYGDIVTISKGALCAQVKTLAKKLDVFVILQSQTTKAKDAGGDIPLGKNAAYGVSNFEWYADYIVTLWRPLKRVQHKSPLRATGWQYCKIRKKHKQDRVEENTPYVLKFNPETNELTEFPENEMAEVNKLIKDADVLRKMEEKKESPTYLNSPVNPTVTKLTLIYKKREG